MSKLNSLTLDMLEKDKLLSVKGGRVNAKVVCPCICVGGPTEKTKEVESVESSDKDCADCGAENAHRVLN